MAIGEPLVSILIPAYNAERWMADTIRSALNQTWHRKEIIIIDDGSSDRTLDVARQFDSPTVKVVSQVNQGAAAARNTAYSICQGDYVQWLDADDVLDPWKIELQVLHARKFGPRKLLSGAWANFAYRIRKARFIHTALCEDLAPVEWLLRKMGLNLHMQTDNWLVSRELSDTAGPWDERLWRDNDGEYFCRVLLASDGVAFVREARSYYRAAGQDSVSRIEGSAKKLESLFLSMNLHIGYLRSLEESSRVRSVCVSYIRTWLHEFFPYRPDLGDKLQKTAEILGGGQIDPTLSWKYDWLVSVFGWSTGRRAQIVLPRMKTKIAVAWDRAMYNIETARHSGAFSTPAGKRT